MKKLMLFHIALSALSFSCNIFSMEENQHFPDSYNELKILEAIASNDYDSLNTILDQHYKKDSFLNRYICLDEYIKQRSTIITAWYDNLHNIRTRNTNITNNSIGGHYIFTPLSFAIAIGNTKMAEFLFEKQIVTMTKACELNDALCAALDYNPSMIPLLHKWGFPLSYGILVRVVESDNVEAMKELIKHGTSLNIKINTKKSSLLHLACSKKNCLTMAQFLLDNGIYIDEPDADGCTPLHEAAGAHLESDGRRCLINYGANSKSVDFLLDRGANVKALTNDGRSVIECLKHNNYDDAKKLLCSGAPYPNPIKEKHKTMLTDLLSNTPILRCLCAEINVPDELKGFITFSTFKSETNNNLNKNYSDLYGLTPLHLATIKGDKHLVDYLLACKKAPKKIKKILLTTPIVSHFIKTQKKPTVDINCRDNQGRTPLMWAARLDHEHIYQTLKKHGANCMIADEKGRIALNYAADYRSRKVFEIMMVDEQPNPLRMVLEDQIESKK